jgi:hypothetical protein
MGARLAMTTFQLAPHANEESCVARGRHQRVHIASDLVSLRAASSARYMHTDAHSSDRMRVQPQTKAGVEARGCGRIDSSRRYAVYVQETIPVAYNDSFP